jgi:CRP-like cAMP-binding protein
VAHLPIERFRTGTVIFNEGDAPGDVYVIMSGTVEIFQTSGESEQIVATLGKDDVFGDMALINDAPRGASARAASNTSCFVISKAGYQQHLEEASPMLRSILKILSTRLREMTQAQNTSD